VASMLPGWPTTRAAALAAACRSRGRASRPSTCRSRRSNHDDGLGLVAAAGSRGAREPAAATRAAASVDCVRGGGSAGTSATSSRSEEFERKAAPRSRAGPAATSAVATNRPRSSSRDGAVGRPHGFVDQPDVHRPTGVVCRWQSTANSNEVDRELSSHSRRARRGGPVEPAVLRVDVASTPIEHRSGAARRRPALNEERRARDGITCFQRSSASMPLARKSPVRRMRSTRASSAAGRIPSHEPPSATSA
jgi:hypothetical protein